MFLSRISNIYSWLVTCTSGLFMFLVLFVYRAYHIDQTPAFTGNSILFRSITHALIISGVFYIVEFHLSPRLRMKRGIKPMVTGLIAIVIGLHLTFLAFNYFYHWTELFWLSYFQFYYEYPLILLIPMTLSYLIARLVELNQSGERALITFLSENQKDQFQLKPENLLFVKSADNYVEIYYHDTKQLGKRLLRNALQKLEEEFQHKNFLIRCHRSYLVNPANIDHVDNASGKVELNVKGEVIPVSKKYANNFISDH